MADYFNPKQNALKNIDRLRSTMKNRSFTDENRTSAEDRKRAYATLLALRWTVDSVRGEKNSLKKDVDANAFQQNLHAMMLSPTLDAFIKDQGEDKFRELLLKGHGGEAEDKLKEYILDQPTLPIDMAPRYMPTAEQRIEHLQGKLKDTQAGSDEAAKLYGEIFRTRRSVNAQRGKRESLAPVLNGAAMKGQPELAETGAFKQFVKEQGSKIHSTIVKGHGGEAEEMFRDYVLHMDRIPADTPVVYLPTAEERLEALQERIKKPDFLQLEENQRFAVYAEMMATRIAVGAVRKDKTSLQKGFTARDKEEAAQKLLESQTFKDFLDDYETEARSAALSGHGGALEDEFKKYVRELDHIPDDVPDNYMPSALERTEALQAKIKSPSFRVAEAGDQVEIMVELMATRQAVDSVRGDKHSLEKPVNSEKLKAAVESWKACATFQTYLEDHAEEAIRAATSGHGGALEDKFKDYVLKLDLIPEDVPARMMPTALERTEALQKKIKDPAFAELGEENQRTVYVELMATRQAAGAIRGKKSSLEQTVDPAALKAARDQWANDTTFAEYLTENPEAASVAARKGHGGALMDGYKEYVRSMDVIPTTVPETVLPTAQERTEALQKQIRGLEDYDEDRALILYAQVLATRSASGAIRGKKDSLSGRIDPAKVEEEYQKLEGSETFRKYLKEHTKEARDAVLSGHGGALEDKFREHVKNLDQLGEDVPHRFLPTALDRTEALQKKFKNPNYSRLTDEQRTKLAAELMGTRRSVSAERGKKETLNLTVDPQKLKASRESLENSKTFKDFVVNNYEAIQKAATSGHGGSLEDLFKEHVRKMSVIPEDVPKEYMPTALERTETLQKMLKSTTDPEKRKNLYKSLAAARMAVSSVRGEKKTLDLVMDPKKQAEAYKKMDESEAFNDMLENHDANAIYNAARSGHGGALDDLFKTHVIQKTANDGCIPKGVDQRFKPMPNQVLEQIKKDMREMSKSGDLWLQANSDLIKRKTACAMYLIKADMTKTSPKDKMNELEPTKMQRHVDVLRNSQGMTNLFRQMGSPRQVVLNVGRNPRNLLENFTAENAQLQQPLQPQQQRNLQQNLNGPEQVLGQH